jgi:prepilin-type N-terminal cleavage/methylation domain-containing protein
MKSPRCHYSGFTLVELLVVIAIIAILAAVLSVSAGAVINAAKRTKAQNTANQIQTAVLNYDTEYGVYPVPVSGTDVLYNDQDNGDWKPLAFALCGNINVLTGTPGASGTVPNSRNIAFLTPKKSEVDTTYGVPFNPFTTAAAPRFFNIAMDADYSGILGDSGASTIPDFTQWTQGKTNSAYVKLTAGSAVWACCDPTYVTNPAGSTSPALWVHTY